MNPMMGGSMGMMAPRPMTSMGMTPSVGASSGMMGGFFGSSSTAAPTANSLSTEVKALDKRMVTVEDKLGITRATGSTTTKAATTTKTA